MTCIVCGRDVGTCPSCRARAHSIYVGHVGGDPVYTADLTVEGGTAQPVGFLADHTDHTDHTWLLGRPNPEWKAPTKHVRSRRGS